MQVWESGLCGQVSLGSNGCDSIYFLPGQLQAAWLPTCQGKASKAKSGHISPLLKTSQQFLTSLRIKASILSMAFKALPDLWELENSDFISGLLFLPHPTPATLCTLMGTPQTHAFASFCIQFFTLKVFSLIA